MVFSGLSTGATSKLVTKQADRLTRQERLYVFNRARVELTIGIVGDVTEMRRCKHVVQRAERMIRRQRLGIERVERHDAEAPFTQRIDQRGFLDQRTTRRVDQDA